MCTPCEETYQTLEKVGAQKAPHYYSTTYSTINKCNKQYDKINKWSETA